MASLRPKNSHVADSVEAAKTYHQMFKGSPAETYVNARGLGEVAETFGLGYVASAIPGHERYRGHLAIPYLRPTGGEGAVATVRYRCIADECIRSPEGPYLFELDEKEQHDHKGGKYLTVPGDVPRIFNTPALIRPSNVLVVVEGEFDAMTWELVGIPAIGAPGTGTWRDYWTPATLGYEKVFLLAEDSAGETFMDSLAAQMQNAAVIKMENDLDSNRTFQLYGADVLRSRIGL